MKPILLVSAAILLPVPAPVQLKLVQTIPLPGVEGRIDHMTADTKAGRLFVAALGNNTLEVVDLKAGKRIHSISGLKEPQGVGFAPDVDRIFVANGQGTGLEAFDGKTYAHLETLPTGDDSDNVRFDPTSGQIVVGYGEGALAFFDAKTYRRLGNVPLPGHPESFQLSRDGMSALVNVPNTHEIASVERVHGNVSHWKISSAAANFPMALDETHGRLFTGCRSPARLLVMDLRDGRQVSSLEIGGDTDDVYYDASRRRVYVVCGEGVVDVFRQESPDRYVREERVKTAPGARTGLFIPGSGRLCVAVPHRAGQQAEIRVYEVGK